MNFNSQGHACSDDATRIKWLVGSFVSYQVVGSFILIHFIHSSSFIFEAIHQQSFSYFLDLIPFWQFAFNRFVEIHFRQNPNLFILMDPPCPYVRDDVLHFWNVTFGSDVCKLTFYSVFLTSTTCVRTYSDFIRLKNVKDRISTQISHVYQTCRDLLLALCHLRLKSIHSEDLMPLSLSTF